MVGYLTKKESENVLTENTFGRIGCNDGFNTYIYPINYVYNGKYIFCHSFIGAKILIMRRNKRVCLEVDELKDFSHWKSVLVCGNYEEFDEERDRYQAIQLFLNHKIALKISESVTIPDVNGRPGDVSPPVSIKPIIYRISIDEITGRYEH